MATDKKTPQRKKTAAKKTRKKTASRPSRRVLLIAAATRAGIAARTLPAKNPQADAAAAPAEKRLRLRVGAAALSAVRALKKLTGAKRPPARAAKAAPAKTRLRQAERTASVTPRRRQIRKAAPKPAGLPPAKPVEIPQWAWAPPAITRPRATPPPAPARKTKKRKNPRRHPGDFLARRHERQAAPGTKRRKSKRLRTAAPAPAAARPLPRRTGQEFSAQVKRGSQSRVQSMLGLWRRARSTRVTAVPLKTTTPARPRAAGTTDKPAARTVAPLPKPAPRVRRGKTRRAPRPARQAKPPAVTARPAPPPQRKIYLDFGPPLPEHYHDDWMFAMVRDPEWVYVYWELSDGRLPALRRVYGAAALAAATWRLQGHTPDGALRFDTTLKTDEFGNWYCRVGSDVSVRFTLALRLPGGRVITVLRSNTVHTPRFAPSANTDISWYVSEPQFVARFLKHYEPPFTSGQRRSFPGFPKAIPNLPGSGRMGR